MLELLREKRYLLFHSPVFPLDEKVSSNADSLLKKLGLRPSSQYDASDDLKKENFESEEDYFSDLKKKYDNNTIETFLKELDFYSCVLFLIQGLSLYKMLVSDWNPDSSTKLENYNQQSKELIDLNLKRIDWYNTLQSFFQKHNLDDFWTDRYELHFFYLEKLIAINKDNKKQDVLFFTPILIKNWFEITEKYSEFATEGSRIKLSFEKNLLPSIQTLFSYKEMPIWFKVDHSSFLEFEAMFNKLNSDFKKTEDSDVFNKVTIKNAKQPVSKFGLRKFQSSLIK